MAPSDAARQAALRIAYHLKLASAETARAHNFSHLLDKMRKVFVSGCYDILHGGHVEFFEAAGSLGDYLFVSFASPEVLWRHKRRQASLPGGHRCALLQNLRTVDEVVMGCALKQGLDFEDPCRRIKPQVLAVTEDDRFRKEKQELCREVDAEYRVLEKTEPEGDAVSTSSMLARIRVPREVPLGVDFARRIVGCPAVRDCGRFHCQLCHRTTSD